MLKRISIAAILAAVMSFSVPALAVPTQAVLFGQLSKVYSNHGFTGIDNQLVMNKMYGMPRLYDTAAHLAADASQADGTWGYALDTHAISIFTNGAWQGVTIASGGNATVSGTLAVTSTLTVTGATFANGGVDRSTAAALAIGATNATAINIGAAATPVVFTPAGAITAPAAILSKSANGIGYLAGGGAGCSVTQATSVTTGVTCNGATGAITTFSETAAQNATVTFTVTDSAVAATDTVLVSVKTNNGAGLPVAWVTTVASTSFTVTIDNLSASALNNTLVLNFTVIKGAIT